MLSKLKQFATFSKPHTYAGVLNKNYVTYRIDQAKAITTTHEQAQVNPLLTKPNGSTMQHPAIVRTLCDIPNCEHKVCKKPCNTPIENSDVGHATHSDKFPGVRYISNTDSSGDARPEFMLPYERPIENTTSGANIDKTKTKNLNDNSEALNNVHLNASKLPAQKADTGSNDPTNIN